MLSFLSLISFRTWFLAAAIAAGAMFITGVYVKGYVAGEYKIQIADLKAREKALLEEIANKKAALEADANMAATQQDTLDVLEKQIEDTRKEFADHNGACFDSNDTDRLRKLWEPSAKH